MGVRVNNSSANDIVVAGAFSAGNWTNICGTGNTLGNEVYVNGISVGTHTDTKPTTLGRDLNIGAWPNGQWAIDAVIDEVRISDIARSDTWIKASYYSENNQLLSYEETEFFGTQINKDGAYGIGRIENTADTVIGIINNNIISVSPSAPGGWQYVNLVYDKVDQKLYVNGVLEKSLSLAVDINSNNSDLIIGGGAFNGPIDEVRISDIALSDYWIKAEYNPEKYPST